jgi:hypothetical protein
MADVISVYSTISQADGFLAEVPGSELLQNRYFRNETKDQFVTKEVLFDFDKLDLKAGAFVKKGFINGDTTKFYSKIVEPPRIGISDKIDPDDYDRIMFEEILREMGEGASRDDAFEMLKRIKVGRLGARAKRSIEKTCVQVLTNMGIHGTQATSDTDPTPVEIDINFFEEEKGNPQRYIPQHAWGTQSATPYLDVCKMVTALAEHGGKPKDLLISPQAWVLLSQDADFKTMVQTYHSEKSVLTGEEFDDAVLVARCVFLGYALDVISYNAMYEDDEGHNVQYLPKDFVCVLSENCGRMLTGGCTGLDPSSILSVEPLSVSSFIARKGKLIATQFVDLRNRELKLEMESRPLPAPKACWGWITMLAENSNEIAGGVVGPAINVLFSTEEEGVTLPDDMKNVPGGSSVTFTVPAVSQKTCDVYLDGVLKIQSASGSVSVTVPNVDCEISFVYTAAE